METEDEPEVWTVVPVRKWTCNRCQTDSDSVDERYSYGIYAGRWCNKCWPKSGYRDACEERPISDIEEPIEPEDY